MTGQKGYKALDHQPPLGANGPNRANLLGQAGAAMVRAKAASEYAWECFNQKSEPPIDDVARIEGSSILRKDSAADQEHIPDPSIGNQHDDNCGRLDILLVNEAEHALPLCVHGSEFRGKKYPYKRHSIPHDNVADGSGDASRVSAHSQRLSLEEAIVHNDHCRAIKVVNDSRPSHYSGFVSQALPDYSPYELHDAVAARDFSSDSVSKGSPIDYSPQSSTVFIPGGSPQGLPQCLASPPDIHPEHSLDIVISFQESVACSDPQQGVLGDQMPEPPRQSTFAPSLSNSTTSLNLHAADPQNLANNDPPENIRPTPQNLRYGVYQGQQAPQSRTTALGSGRLQNASKSGSFQPMLLSPSRPNPNDFRASQATCQAGALERQMVCQQSPRLSKDKRVQGQTALHRRLADHSQLLL